MLLIRLCPKLKSTIDRILNYQIKSMITHTVKFIIFNDIFSSSRKVLYGEEVFSECGLPNSCLSDVCGSTIFEEQSINISPITTFLCENIINCSHNMVLSHKQQITHARIIMQVTFLNWIIFQDFNDLSFWLFQNFSRWRTIIFHTNFRAFLRRTVSGA